MSYLPDALMRPALKFRSTRSTSTEDPLNVACAVKLCSGSPASRPCVERMSATPLIAFGIPVDDWIFQGAGERAVESQLAPEIDSVGVKLLFHLRQCPGRN